MADGLDAFFPRHESLELAQELGPLRITPADEPHQVIAKRVGQARLGPEHEVPGLKAVVHPLQLRPDLGQGRGQVAGHLGYVIAGTEIKRPPVFPEIVGQVVAGVAKHQGDNGSEQGPVCPPPDAPGHARGAAGEQGRFGIQALNLADDGMGIAIDVGADLHYRGQPVAAGHWHQVGLRWQPGNGHRAPVQVLEAEDDANLFRHRRLRIMVEDDVAQRSGSLF